MARFRWPSPAMIVACISLAIALSGVGYAAVTLPRNSVGTLQLKKNAVVSKKVKDNSLTGADVNEARLGQVPSAAIAGSATTAGSATNAQNATNAENATNAGNANSLDGVDSTGFAPATHDHRTTVTQRFSCAGTGFNHESTLYGSSESSSGTRFVDGSVIGWFTCPVHLPDGARVTSVTYLLYDSHSNGRIDSASLTRFGIRESNLGVFDGLASPSVASSTYPGEPGYFETTDTSISNDVIDNSLYAYALRLRFAASSSEDFTLGLRGATITYQLRDVATATP